MTKEPDQKNHTKEEHRLNLEIEEREWNKSLRGRLTKVYAPLFLLIFVFWQVHVLNKQYRLQAITIHKKEFFSENPIIRKGAALALADYPKEATLLLIDGLGDKDTTFTDAVKTSLKQIGVHAVAPLADRLRDIRGKIMDMLSSGNDEEALELFQPLPICILFSRNIDNVKDKLKTVSKTNGINLGYNEIDRIVKRADSIKSSKAVTAYKNCADTLAYILRTTNIWRYRLSYIYHYQDYRLKLKNMDLSGTNLEGANLADFDMSYANLTGANLSNSTLGAQLSRAILSQANLAHANLSGTALSDADLSDAYLFNANLSGALLLNTNLSGANLSDADLTGVIGFMEVENFSGTNLRGVKGLSKEQLEYAKSKGAIIN